MSKPIVYFSKIIGWSDDGKIEKGTRALIGGVENHPLLGYQREVNTSMVLKIRRDRKTKEVTQFETLNTIYRKREVTK